MKKVLVIYFVVFVFGTLCLSGCKTSRQVEQTFIGSTASDSTKQVMLLETTKHDSIYVHDSVYVEYRIGRTDTINLVRVDTLYKYREKTAYRVEKAAKLRIDTLIQVRTDTLIITNTKTKTIEKAAKVSLWKRLLYLLAGAVVAIILLMLIRYIKGK